MRFKRFLNVHHDLIISIVDIVQIINVFAKSTIIAIFIIIARSVMRKR